MTRVPFRRRPGWSPLLEPMEGRWLLSSAHVYPFADVHFGGALYTITVSGPGGVLVRRAGHGMVIVDLFATTQDSQVTVTPVFAHSKTGVKPLQLRQLNVHSGRLGSFQALTTADLLGPMTPLAGPVNSLQFDALGPAAQVDVNGNLAQLTVNRDVNLKPGGHLDVAQDVTGSFNVTGNVTVDGGQIQIGRDMSGPLNVGGDLALLHGGRFVVGRDLAPAAGAGARVTGNLVLTNGTLAVGREFGSLAAGGNLDTSGGGAVQVGGDLKNLTVNGFIQGKGAGDITIGLNLGQLTVLGGADGRGGLRDVDLSVAKSIQGVDVRFGVFNSLITAGILIDGGTPGAGSNGWNIGPDAPVAVFDSEIRAGSQIRNLVIGGDVVSDHPTNPAGRLTRIVAGENRQGIFDPNNPGSIDNFQIVGRLVDAVLAASVQPFDGTGAVATTPTPGSDDDGYKTYDAPVGTVQVGFVGNSPVTQPNFTAPPYDPMADPTIDDLVLKGGSINRSFAASPLPTSPPPSTGTRLPLPSKSTVLGGVISTHHGDQADFAGIFAADTSGVFVGPLPP